MTSGRGGSHCPCLCSSFPSPPARPQGAGAQLSPAMAPARSPHPASGNCHQLLSRAVPDGPSGANPTPGRAEGQPGGCSCPRRWQRGNSKAAEPCQEHGSQLAPSEPGAWPPRAGQGQAALLQLLDSIPALRHSAATSGPGAGTAPKPDKPWEDALPQNAGLGAWCGTPCLETGSPLAWPRLRCWHGSSPHSGCSAQLCRAGNSWITNVLDQTKDLRLSSCEQAWEASFLP